MTDLSKVEAAFKVATKSYVEGKIKYADLQKALRKLEEAGRKMGRDLDFRDIEHYIEKRRKHFASMVRDSSVNTMSKDTWKLVKKEAGIKSSGFLKKSDASVGSAMEKYAKAYETWQASVIKTEGGDHQLLLKAFGAAEALKKALKSFIAAKEFKTDLAVSLQAKCEAYIKELDVEIGKLASLSKEAHDSTAGLNTINQLGFAQFKV